MSNHFYLVLTEVVYGMLHLFAQHQYPLVNMVNEIRPPHKRDNDMFLMIAMTCDLLLK